MTRYYDALREEKPFNEQVDYGQPIGLIAITPKFHRDNFTDRKYNHLSIQFLELEIVADGKKFYLQLKDLDSGKFLLLEIHHQETDITDDIAAPPRALLNRLAKSDKSSDKEREAVLRIRKKILSFDSRMQEVVKANKIEYGKGKNYPCAEIYFSNNWGYAGRPNLFLRLPEPSPYYRQSPIRMHIGTDKDWDTFSGMIFFPRAFISSNIRGFTRYEFPQFIEIIKRCAHDEVVDERTRICYQNYEKLIKSGTNSLELLVETALETWLKRL